MSNVWNRFAVAFVSVVFPVAAFADISGTQLSISANTSVSMDTATTVTSGADFLWDGSKLTPQGSAIAFSNAALSGMTGYNTLTPALLSQFSGLGSSSPITGLAANSVVGYKTNGGNFGKLLVTSVSGGTLVVQYTTYISTTTTITQIQNNYGLIAPGLPNYGIAPSALFIIRGSNLASIPISSATLQSSASPGIPLTLNGASISVTVNGTTVHPGIYYAGATQIAAVLPANTPIGTGTLTVTYNSATSNAASILVVPSALGLDTYYGSGSGLGVATNATTGALYNYTNSIAPGTTIVLWGSGAGATGDSDIVFTTSPHAASSLPTIYIGGVQANVLYAGSAGYPGVNQINVTVPASVPTGCGVSVVAVNGSIVSNTITLPINVGGGVCNDPLTGINGSQIGTLTGKSNYNSGVLILIQSTSAGKTISGADAIFENVQTTSSSTVSGITSVGSCSVTSQATIGTITIPTITGLDAGTITVTGPLGSQTLTTIPTLAGDYIAQLASGFIPASGGSFTFTGTGGKDVGSFTSSISYTNPLNWTNSSIATVTRASGQNITWTGGASGSFVYIGGTSSSSTASASFVCYAPASAGSFTVPSYVLLALPSGNGTLGITNEATPVSFTASGLDYGTMIVGVSFSISPNYQ